MGLARLVTVVTLGAMLALTACAPPQGSGSWGSYPSGGYGGASNHQAPAQDSRWRPAGAPVSVVAAPTTHDHQRLLEVHGDLANRFGRLFAALIKLRRPISFVFEDCRDSPYYMRGADKITICYGFLGSLEKQLKTDRWVRGASAFIVLHELAHALIDQLDLPVVGNAEDAADRFALSMLMSTEHGAELALGAARFFQSGVPVSRRDFADEHPVHDQRFFTILCAVAGAQPKVFAAGVEKGVLPPDRLNECPGEMRRTRAGWNRLLAPYSNVESGTTFFE